VRALGFELLLYIYYDDNSFGPNQYNRRILGLHQAMIIDEVVRFRHRITTGEEETLIREFLQEQQGGTLVRQDGDNSSRC
jgi:hypothetical protein